MCVWRDGRSGLRMEREGGRGGGVDHRIWIPGQAFISTSYILLRCVFCCRLDVMQTLLAANRRPAVGPVCPTRPDGLMHWARHSQASGGAGVVAGRHL